MNVESQQSPERRQVTVLFCDLVDSSGLVEQLDPEETHALMLDYQSQCASAIESEGGEVYRFAGDGVVARFGYPVSSEDNAEQAIRAGLAATRHVRAIKLPRGANRDELQCRVGIATGVAVVSEMRGGSPRDHVVVVGEAPTLAARLQELASPGGVIVCETTWLHARAKVVGASLGAKELKGLSRSTEVFRVDAIADAADPRSHASTFPVEQLIGREIELAQLMQKWRAACDGRGATIRLVGEAGVGKSTMVSALRSLLASESQAHECFAHYASSRRRTTQFHPIVRELQWRAARDAEPDLTREEIFTKALDTEFEVDAMSRAVALSVLMPEASANSHTEGMSASARRERVLGMLTVRLLGAGIGGTPRLLIFEDLQWLDATTLNLIERLVMQCRTARALIVLTHRPDVEIDNAISDHSEVLTTSQLGDAASRDLIERLSGDRALPESAVREIVARSDGIPLFVEELTNSVLASREIADRGQTDRSKGTNSRTEANLVVPSTLRDALTARLDRIPQARRTAQVASAAGRIFDKDLVREVLGMSVDEFEASLASLVQAGILRHGADTREHDYVFKHALVQEVAYSTMLLATRKSIHHAIAESIEQRTNDATPEHPQLLAQHWSSADEPARAARYWYAAGAAAARQSAYTEAQQHLYGALDELRKLEGDERDEALELAIQTTLGPCLTATEGYLSKRVEEAYQRAAVLTEKVSDVAQSARLMRGSWAYQQVAGRLEQAGSTASDLIELAERQGDTALLCEAHRISAQTALFQGRHQVAENHLQRAIDLYDPVACGESATLYGNDTLAVILSYQAWNAWFLGHPVKCERSFEAAITRAHETRNPYTITQILTDSTHGFILRRDIGGALSQAQTTSGYATAQAYPYWRMISEFLRTWAQHWPDVDASACDEMRIKLSFYSRVGVLALPWFQCLLADALLRAGRTEACIEESQAALDLAKETGELVAVPELLRVQGIALRSHDHERAMTRMHEAVDAARSTGALGWELRAATTLARATRDDMKGALHRAALTQVLERLPSDHSSRDADDARMLLSTR